MVVDALARFETWYSSNAAFELESDISFESSFLSKNEKTKYDLLDKGSVNDFGIKVKGDKNDLFFLRNCYQYNPKYLVTNDSQVLLSCNAIPETQDTFGDYCGKHGTFYRTKVFSSNPFLCTEIYSRNWENGSCVD